MSPTPAGHTPLRRFLPVLAVDAVFLPLIVWLVLSERGRDPIGIGSLTLMHVAIALFVACSAAVVWLTIVRPARDARSQATLWERR